MRPGQDLPVQAGTAVQGDAAAPVISTGACGFARLLTDDVRPRRQLARADCRVDLAFPIWCHAVSFDQRLVGLNSLGHGRRGGIRLALRPRGPRHGAGPVGRCVSTVAQFSTGAGGFESYGRVGAAFGRRARLDRYLYQRKHRYRKLEPRRPGGGNTCGLRAPEPEPADQQRHRSRSSDCISCWGASSARSPTPPLRARNHRRRPSRVAGGERSTPSQLAAALLGRRRPRVSWTSTPSGWRATVQPPRRNRTPRAGASRAGPERSALHFLAPYSRDFLTVEAR